MKKFNLAKYIIPSVISMVLVGTYTNIDGLFIGNRAGDEGLAAINIAWPIVAFITSVGTGIGVGGSVAINRLRGQGKTADAEITKATALWLLIIAGLVSTALCLAVYSPLLKLLNASGQTLVYAQNYALVVSAGALFQVLGAGLVVLLRNEGKTYPALLYTAIGLAVHVGLDFIMVKNYALYGVAASTAASQAVVALLAFCSFVRAKKIKNKGEINAGFGLYYNENGEKSVKNTAENFNKNSGERADERVSEQIRGEKFEDKGFFKLFVSCKLKNGAAVLKNSAAPFGLNFVPSAVLLFTNYFALEAGGTAAVSAYAVMSYLLYTYDYVFQGVCDGVQPVLSYYNGAGEFAEKRNTARRAIIILAVFSLVFIAITPLAIAFLPKVFSVSAEAESMLRTGFIVYAFSYPIKATVKFICAYAYSVEKTLFSNVITYSDPFLFTPLCLFVLSAKGINGVWISLPLAQLLIVLSAAIWFFVIKKRVKKSDNR